MSRRKASPGDLVRDSEGQVGVVEDVLSTQYFLAPTGDRPHGWFAFHDECVILETQDEQDTQEAPQGR